MVRVVHERIVTVPLDQPLVICAPTEASLVTTEGARVLAPTEGRVLAPVPPLLGRFDVVGLWWRLRGFPSLREVNGGRRGVTRRGGRRLLREAAEAREDAARDARHRNAPAAPELEPGPALSPKRGLFFCATV